MPKEIITTTQNQLSQIRSPRITDVLSSSEKTVLEVKGKGRLLRKYSLSELNTFLSSLAQLVGVTPANMPDINAMKLLMDSVIHLYGHLTDQEVKNAFNLLI